MSSLYLDHFGLNKPPFQITPDLDFFFSGGHRGDILSALLHVAANEEGIITLIAEVGSGKTLLARLMISRLDPQISTVYLANPSFSRDEILGAIARDLGLIDLPTSTEGRLSTLQQELLRRHGLGERVLLVIDEAHAMPPESLEEVRLLSNLETGQHKLVNIMLFGQPELEELLADRRLRQVRDRVVHRFKLMPLPAEDVRAYVDHRLRAAGWKGGPLFSPSAMALLIKASGGRARRINLLADKALLASYAQSLRAVEPRQVQDAIGELHDDFSNVASRQLPAWAKWAVLSVALAVCMTALLVWMLDLRRTDLAPISMVANDAKAATVDVGTKEVSAVPAVAAVSDHAPKQEASHLALGSTAVTKKAISPALPSTVSLSLQPYLERTRQHLLQPGLTGYSVQLASLPRDASAPAYLNLLSQHIDSAIIFAQLSRYNGREFVSAFVGHFDTVAEAKAAMAGWPASLKTNKPIVRTWLKIRQDQPT